MYFRSYLSRNAHASVSQSLISQWHFLRWLLLIFLNRRPTYASRRHNFSSFCCNVQLCTLFMASVTSGSYTKTALNPQGNFGAGITQSLKILSQCHPPTRCIKMSSYEKQHRIINNLNITTDFLKQCSSTRN